MGDSAEQAMATVVRMDPTADYRQLTVVDGAGRVAGHTGHHALGVYRVVLGDAVIAAGNLLAAPSVVDAMLRGFQRSDAGNLAGRLLDGLAAGEGAGGEVGPLHSAGLAVTHPTAGWAETDLRVDWDETDPVGHLRHLWSIWEPQRLDYITRGIDPARAPAYGVPGDQ